MCGLDSVTGRLFCLFLGLGLTFRKPRCFHLCKSFPGGCFREELQITNRDVGCLCNWLLNGHEFACFIVVLLVMLCNLSFGENSSSPGPMLLHQYGLKPQRSLTGVGLFDVCPVSIRA